MLLCLVLVSPCDLHVHHHLRLDIGSHYWPRRGRRRDYRRKVSHDLIERTVERRDDNGMMMSKPLRGDVGQERDMIPRGTVLDDHGERAQGEAAVEGNIDWPQAPRSDGVAGMWRQDDARRQGGCRLRRWQRRRWC